MSATCESAPLAARQGPWAELQLAEEDHARVKWLDPSDVDSWMQQRVAEYEYRIRALKFARNAASTINRKLPREVLAEIFAYLPLVGPGGREYRHTAYLLVCRAWYALLRQTPRFWAGLLNQPLLLTNTFWGTGLYDRYLERSGAVPLALSIHLLSEQILRSLTPHCYRITSLRVDISMDPERELGTPLLNSLLSAGMPSLVNLEVIHIHQYDPPRTGGSLILNVRHLPRLQSLARPWTSVVTGDAVARLRHLRLEGCRECESSRFALKPLRDAVAQCPVLETLMLSMTNVFHAERMTIEGADVGCVVHSTLARLQLRDCQPATVKEILARLAYPRTCHVSFAAKSLQDVLPAAPFPLTSMADRVKIEFRYSSQDNASLTTYIRSSKAMSFTFKHDRQDAEKAFQICMTDLSAVFSKVNTVTALTLHGTNGHKSPSFGEDDARYFGELLRALPNLVQLDILGWDCRHWLDALMDGTKSSRDGHEECLCPRMRELTIYWKPLTGGSFLPLDILLMVRPARGSRSPDRRRLRSVVFDAYCDSIARMLRYRAQRGSPLERLSVLVAREVIESYIDDKGWEPPVLRERMWKELEGLVEKLDVSLAS